MVWGFVDIIGNPVWQEADEDSRESAIACGRREFGEQATFWISPAEYPDAGDMFPAARELVERASENAGDNWGEVSEDWPDMPSDEALQELDDFIGAWARKHCPVSFWLTSGNFELITPPSNAPQCVGGVGLRARCFTPRPRCPTCGSPEPHRHPHTGFYAGTKTCSDPWHEADHG